MRLLGCTVVAVLISLSPLNARDVDCNNALTQADMNYCAYQSYLRADEDLNLAYGLAMEAAREMDRYLKDGDVPAAKLLKEAQRAWITFRDKACEVESTLFRGGSMQPLIHSSCLERETRNRTEALRYFGEVN